MIQGINMDSGCACGAMQQSLLRCQMIGKDEFPTISRDKPVRHEWQ
jgi:hypothetical protein